MEPLFKLSCAMFVFTNLSSGISMFGKNSKIGLFLRAFFQWLLGRIVKRLTLTTDSLSLFKLRFSDGWKICSVVTWSYAAFVHRFPKGENWSGKNGATVPLNGNEKMMARLQSHLILHSYIGEVQPTSKYSDFVHFHRNHSGKSL